MAYGHKNSEPVCTITLPLRTQPWQRDKLDRIFQCYNNLKNILTDRKLRDLRNMERTRKWRSIQRNLKMCYTLRDELEVVLKKSPSRKQSASEREAVADLKEQQAANNKRVQELHAQRKEMLEAYGFTSAAFEKCIQDVRTHYRSLIHSQTGQVLANDVWDAFDSYFYGNGKQIRFNSIFDLTYVRGKSNETGIRYSKGFLDYAGMHIPVKRSRKDPFGYEAEMLSRKIHYCGIMRKWYPDGWRYFAKLTVSGTPAVKVDPHTGVLHHAIGDGRVGLDIEPQTLAVVGDAKVALVELASRVQHIENELRVINRAMDRSRRATNPNFFDERGKVIPIDKLPPELLTPRGKRVWVKSKRYLKLESYRRYLYRKQADARLQQHRAMANQLLTFGDQFIIEDMNWKALAKRSKETKQSKTGKNLSKKRFGRSIANKAPALFVKCLEYRAAQMGCSVQKLNTRLAKASQYNHEDKTYLKKKLSQRWNYMPDGSKVQRDLYSAFLIQNANDALDGFDQAELEARYANFLKLHDEEIRRLHQLKSLPSSMGIHKRSA